MSLAHSPKIITKDLVFYLDGKNPKSYTGDFAVLKDISHNKNTTSYVNNTGALSYDDATQSFERTTMGFSDTIRSTNKIDLSGSFTMNTLAYVYGLANAGTANGIITNHSYTQNAGGGITLHDASATDWRISCNTGNGTSRTFTTYYGTSNIKDRWAYLTMRYDDVNKLVSLWVNGVKEKEVSYTMYCIEDYIDLFCWSTTHYTSGSYRPACKLNNVSVYSTDLTDLEIMQNFNALRGRFGI